LRINERVLVDRPPPYSEVRLETERLHVRAWREEDAEAAFRIYGDPVVVEHLTGTAEESVETQRETLGQIIRAYSALGMGLGSFPLILREGGDLVGAVLLKPLPRNEHLEAWRRFRTDASAVPPVTEVEVGWHLRRDCWGMGYATESASAALDYGFSTLRLSQVYAVYYRANIRSSRVADRLRMEDVGTVDRFYGVELRLRRVTAETWQPLIIQKTGN
jgi:RimJ/RimL family protein N-acetyltransferase